MFLTYLGDDAYDVYETSVTPGEHTFDEVINILDAYFKPKTNRSYETYVFRKMRQNVNETTVESR